MLENHMVLNGSDAPWNARDASCRDCHTQKNLVDVRTIRGQEITVCEKCVADLIEDGEVAAPEVEEED